MNKKYIEFLKNQIGNIDDFIWDDYLIRTESHGQTKETVNLGIVHSGRESSSIYVLGKLVKSIDEIRGENILKAIEELQVKNKSDHMFGAFRMYREGSKPMDTNAAFFTMLPLIIIRLYESSYLSIRELKVIDRMINNSASWFSKECKNPILYYTNKIISDGALLTCIGKLTDDESYKKQAREFLLKWLDYTEKRGYGWGENLSLGYNAVILQGFALIKKSLNKTIEDQKIAIRFDKLEQEILDIFRFHNGYEFTPTIRTYNATGELKIHSLIYNLAGVNGYSLNENYNLLNEQEKKNPIFNISIAFMVYGERLYLNNEDLKSKHILSDLKIPRVKETRIMDEKKSYTWLGKNGGLGSINKFPVIEGSYQHKTWGLGWQCCPVNMIVYDNQVSMLRFNVNDGKRFRHHPHKEMNKAYFDPALFGESHYPDVKTACSQKNNTLITIRSINALRNNVKSISDSFDIQRFKGEISEYNINNRQWIILSYKKATVMISPLLGIKACVETDSQCTLQNSISIDKDGTNISLIQWLYNGKEKILYDDRISCGWLIHFVDNFLKKEDIENYLNEFVIKDLCYADCEVPRTESWYIHDVLVKYKDEVLGELKYDPYSNSNILY